MESFTGHRRRNHLSSRAARSGFRLLRSSGPTKRIKYKQHASSQLSLYTEQSLPIVTREVAPCHVRLLHPSGGQHCGHASERGQPPSGLPSCPFSLDFPISLRSSSFSPLGNSYLARSLHPSRGQNYGHDVAKSHCW